MKRKSISLKKIAASVLLILSVCLIPAHATSVSAKDGFSLYGVPENVVVTVNGEIVAPDESGVISGLHASDKINVAPAAGYSITDFNLKVDGAPVVDLNVPEKIWADDGGYTMLLDSDATAYSKVDSYFTKDFKDLKDFEYVIPGAADISIESMLSIVQGSSTLTVTEGKYDLCIVVADLTMNPVQYYYSTSLGGTASGRMDDFEFERGKRYEFTVTKYDDINDQVKLEITDQEAEFTKKDDGSYDFEFGDTDLILDAEAKCIKVTYVANGGIPGPDWKDSVIAPYGQSMEGTIGTPSEDYIKAQDGMEFDGYVINGTFYPNGTNITIYYTEDLLIKCMWKTSGIIEEYYFSEGDDATWTKDSSSPHKLTVKRNSNDEYTYQLFKKLEMDGSEVAAECFTTYLGSIEISLNSDYLKGLATGDHKVNVVFKDGSVETTLTVAAGQTPEEPEKDDTDVPRENPNTGMNGFAGTFACISMIWMILLSQVFRFRKDI